MTKKISTRGREVAETIARREDFITHGALHGRWLDHSGGFGQLCVAEYDAYASVRGLRYTVFSYATPIAWWTKRDGWHIVDQKFSVTTSKHQTKLYLCEQEG